MDEFHEDNFSLWKFKMNIVLGSMDLWDIVNESEKALPSNADPKVVKEYQRIVKKFMSIISPNLTEK